MQDSTLKTDQKALRINLDEAKYGTCAEIGAGQEVARLFFRVGGASLTVAKTMSAYDMTVSDAIYGGAPRYVSRERLRSMLDHEYRLLLDRLNHERGSHTEFFAFANTVATCPYKSGGTGNGWLGIRFQHAPRQQPSEILIHVKMLDQEIVREQEALGIVGINLIYGAFFQNDDPEELIRSLTENLARGRIEIDMISFSGPKFEEVDNRLMALQLVEQRLTRATMFTSDGRAVIPSEILYKKPVLIERGSFRPLTNPMLEMLESSFEQFVEEPELRGEEPVALLEMTLRQLRVGAGIDHQDFLDRVDMLSALNKPVLISNYRRYHRLVNYISGYTNKMIGLPLGLSRFKQILDEEFYTDLDGGLMESLGQLFRNGVKLYVYPWKDPATGDVHTLRNTRFPQEVRHLFDHLLYNRFIEDVEFTPSYLSISSHQVLQQLQSGDISWQDSVPEPIARTITTNGLFQNEQIHS